MFKIEKNVQLPSRGGHKKYLQCRDLIDKLEVGDMARLYGEYREIPSHMYHTAAKQLGYKIAYRTLKNIHGKASLCVWRIE